MRSLPVPKAAPWTRARLAPSVVLLALGLGASGGSGQSFLIPSAAPGLIETGAPSFVVLGPEALGLSSPPTDIHELPDGRILVVAAQELAIGDGVRWEAFQRHPDTDPVPLTNVAIDTDGGIYASLSDGFARLEFGDDAQWRFVRVAPFPADAGVAGRILSRVSTAHGEWYWSGGSGALVAWHPGRTATVLGTMNDSERALPVGDKVFVGDSSNGAIYRIAGDKLEVFDAAETRKVSRTFLCSVSLPDGRAIVGTYTLGALVFDGQDIHPLVDRGPLAGKFRIVDLCATTGGYFCAALDNLGLVFFCPDGRIVQVLDRFVDHRLSRVRRLLYTPGGVVWALLNEGVAQVEFPARVSRFESLVATGLTYAQLCRHEGRLWLLADGQAQRGVYDVDGRLLRFEVDSPGPFVSTILSASGRLLLATNIGIYQRVEDTWQLVAADIINAHLSTVEGDPDRWLLVAQDEVGWIHATAGGLTVERQPVPRMGSSFGTIIQTGDVFWAELGASRVARIKPRGEQLEVRVLGRADGFPDGWVQAFVVDGLVRFNVASKILRYDPATDRIVEDPEFLPYHPGLVGETGRPARDAQGRLWVTTNDSVCVLAADAGPGAISQERMPPAFTPIAFTMETQGAVWMHQRQRLMRFDPAMPEAETVPLRARISHVQLIGSNRHLLFLGGELPALDYRDNSLVAHFLAPNTVFGHPVTFEVRLEGANDAWVPTGTAGSASFNHLKEGRYVLHVRPRAGATMGEEATLAFSIRPPWFRTMLAYALYGLAAVAGVLAAAAGWSLLARREQARLARLVLERTTELRRSEERFRRLSEELEQRVDLRTTELHRANDRLVESNQELEAFSYSVSHDLRAPLRNISGFAELLRKRASGRIDGEIDRYLGIVSTESVRLGELIDSLLVFSRLNRAELNREPLDLAALAAAARTELAPEAAGRTINWHIDPLPRVEADPTLVRQVFVNLLSNALKFTRGRDPAVICLGTAPEPAAPGEVVVFVRDNGTGFDPKYADKMFGVFQRLHSSREYEGSGIGLATVRRIIVRHGGRVWAEGAAGVGATFFFSLPAARATTPPSPSP